MGRYKVKPTILIYYDNDNMAQIPLRKLREGLEEEGVPWEEKEVHGNAQFLAKQAAQDSQLGIGIGLISDGTCLLQHSRMSVGNPIMKVMAGADTMENYRVLGANAARLAKNMPLKWF
ncbi:glycerol dehydratase reactivase beta/small subunit family protein [Tepidanaerobacter sp. GT38]|uniref:glycerol dehydratase reactivase beta/small subunit family protein n=1 Tax=Tepidanaerobacter sp. GT38 TaxID=2722793 RepID=UPI001F1DABEE|nr:glycerol dehydratase reactivase beta/small subunit family protein [Tepidanaerobacter sp. GT38]MCG1013019.1 glycerol dehydratase reactivase beta/small subunit family protein [Tepidanaerobacter sp. GT38]